MKGRYSRRGGQAALNAGKLMGGLLLAGGVALLAGCGGSDSPSGGGGTGGGSTAITVVPSLGQISNAMVEVRCGMSTMGSGPLTAGQATITVTGTCATPLIVDVFATTSSSYFDESTLSSVAFPTATDIRALVPNFVPGTALSLGVTALTEMAFQRALKDAGNSETAITNALALTANTEIPTQVFGAGTVFNILTPPTLWNSSTSILGTSAGDQYAFLLGTLAQLASGTGTPALDAMQAFGDDLSDGTLSGGTSGSFTYTAAGLAAQLQAAMDDLAGYADASLRTTLGIDPPASVLAITSISPNTGAVGSNVTINGTGFDTTPDNNLVQFANGSGGFVTADAISATSTSLVVPIPTGAATGTVRVALISAPTAFVNSAAEFVVTAAPVTPTITSFSPTSGVIGTTVVITGTGFSATAAENIVRFTGTGPTGIQATVSSASTTSLTVTVPTGSATGALTVYNIASSATGSSSGSFTVTAAGGPTVTGLSPGRVSYLYEGKLYIAGTGLGSVTAVKVGDNLYSGANVKHILDPETFVAVGMEVLLNSGTGGPAAVTLLNASLQPIHVSTQTVDVSQAPPADMGIALTPTPTGNCSNMVSYTGCGSGLLADFDTTLAGNVGQTCRVVKSGNSVSVYLNGSSTASSTAMLDGSIYSSWALRGGGYEHVQMLGMGLDFYNGRLYRVGTGIFVGFHTTNIQLTCQAS